MRKLVLFLLAMTPALTQAGSRDDRERAEVLAIFDLLTSKVDLTTTDPGHADMECVFGREWGDSYRKDAKGEDELFRPCALLTLQQALDPKDKRPDMFCDYKARDDQAQLLANVTNKQVGVSNVVFGYPVFAPDMKSASVRYWRDSRYVAPVGKGRMMGSGELGEFTLHKKGGVWRYEYGTWGIAD